MPLVTYKLVTFSQIWFLTILFMYLFIVKRVVAYKEKLIFYGIIISNNYRQHVLLKLIFIIIINI